MVNLYSDTQTRPSSAMRKAMAEAEVGDEQRMEDPQVTELCERVADLRDSLEIGRAARENRNEGTERLRFLRHGAR